MIEEPYRWVEAIANRREYIEDQLQRGSPVVLVNHADGLLLLTVSRETRKIFEIYDRIAFSALGHPADIERLRLAAIDLAHVEGFSRAVNDVSLRRLVNFGMSPALKGAFEQVFNAPYIVRMLLAEVGDEPARDYLVKLDYDGSFGRSELEMREPFDVLAGTRDAEQRMLQYLVEHEAAKLTRAPLEEAIRLAAKTWAVGIDSGAAAEAVTAEPARPGPTDAEAVKILKEHLKTRHIEAGVLDRGQRAAAKFHLLDEKEIRAALKDL